MILFARRGSQLSAEAEERFLEIHTALESEASDATPTKHAKIRTFLSKHGLSDLLHAANRCLDEANAFPAHGAAAFRLRRKAVVLALLLNGVDRQGDLSEFRIGREIVRQKDGLWRAEFRQAKTRGRKDLGPYWPITSRMIDLHVLAGRPEWLVAARLEELDGANLVGLEDGAFSTYHPAAAQRCCRRSSEYPGTSCARLLPTLCASTGPMPLGLRRPCSGTGRAGCKAPTARAFGRPRLSRSTTRPSSSLRAAAEAGES
ncbi:hypothetical protein [Cereibacter changlensis]|uniref:hypothetical protein n=1 Tax=Cereibacter changlensis TaxID=402884 RepID=UPI000DAB6BDF|nr:hypothetical protein [Cereibacter changlensis]